MTTPTTAESPVTTASETAVRAPLRRSGLTLRREIGTLHRPPRAYAASRTWHRLHLDRERARRPPPGVRRRLRRPHRARHRRRRLHGLAPHRRARPARRGRPRVRARHLERRAEQHRAPARAAEGPLRRPHRQDLDRLPRARAPRRARPAVRVPPRRAGARRRVVAPAVRDGDGEHDRHAQPAPVDRRLGARAREVRHRRHLRGVRQRPRGGRAPPRLRRGRRPDPARALADQPEVDLRDREGRRRLPDDELPRRVRRPGRRHADVQQLRPAPEPALRHRHDHHAGARARETIELGTPRAAARLLLLHRRRPRPPDGRRARRPRRRLRLRPGREHLDGRLGRPDPPDRRGARLLARDREIVDDREALPPGRERRDGAPRRLREAQPRDRLGAAGLVGGRRRADDRLVRGEPRPLDRPRRLAGRRAVDLSSGG